MPKRACMSYMIRIHSTETSEYLKIFLFKNKCILIFHCMDKIAKNEKYLLDLT